MTKLAQSVEQVRISVVSYRDFLKKNHVILVCLNYHTVMIQQSRNFYSDEIEQILWCWFKIRSSCVRPDAAVFGLYVYLCAVQS